MKKILIVGAGISGLFLANLLEKSGKYDYKILEKKNHIGLDEGYGIQLSVNGIRLLNQAGFKHLAVHQVNNPRNLNFYDAKNSKLISNIDISRFNQDGNFYTTLKRSTLLNFLINNIPKDKILLGADIQNIEQNNSFKVILKNNSLEESNFLAICDGIFSKTKKMLLGDKKNIKYYNAVAIRGIIKKAENKDISLYLGPNFHFVIYSINQTNEANFISIIREKNLGKIETNNKYSLALEFLRKISRNSNCNFNNILEKISLYPVYVSNKLIKPDNNNIFLAGDALFAFPPSFAQGASQSIESSYEVFKNLEQGSHKYYKERKMKLNNVKYRSKLNHYAFHVSNPITKIARNIALKYLTKNDSFLENYLGKIYK